jgi:hypothetical protein
LSTATRDKTKCGEFLKIGCYGLQRIGNQKLLLDNQNDLLMYFLASSCIGQVVMGGYYEQVFL